MRTIGGTSIAKNTHAMHDVCCQIMHRLKEVTWCPQHTTKQKHPYIFRRHHLTEHSPYVNFTQIPYQRSEMKIMKRLPHQVSERIFLLIRLAETETPRRKDSRHFRYESLTTHSQRNERPFKNSRFESRTASQS